MDIQLPGRILEMDFRKILTPSAIRGVALIGLPYGPVRIVPFSHKNGVKLVRFGLGLTLFRL